MSPTREWKTEGEIKAIAEDVAKEGRLEVQAARKELLAKLDEHGKTLDRIADGAQASIYSATILHGDAQLGLKGVLPDLQERLGAMEQREVTRDALWDGRHVNHTRRLIRLEKGQHRIRRFGKACVKFLAHKASGEKEGSEGEEKPKLAWWRLGTAVGLLGTSYHWVKTWLPIAGRKIAAAAHAFAK